MQEDGDAAPAPAKAGVASLDTACGNAGIQTSERPIGKTPKLGAEPGVWTERMLAASDADLWVKISANDRVSEVSGGGFPAAEGPSTQRTRIRTLP
jgi:hypothetical protein